MKASQGSQRARSAPEAAITRHCPAGRRCGPGVSTERGAGALRHPGTQAPESLAAGVAGFRGTP